MHSLKTSVDPGSFFQSFVAKTFGRNSDNDMSEFLQFVLDEIHDCCKVNWSEVENDDMTSIFSSEESQRRNFIAAAAEREAFASLRHHFANDFSFIRKLFIGQYIVSLKSSHGTESNTFDPFSVLTLPVPDKKGCDLHECFHLWMQSEVLDGWRDERSGCLVKAEMFKGLWNLSAMLVIHLNRFIGTSKNFCQVKFPATLNFSQLTETRCGRDYSLVAVANHIGNTNAGHCYADCKRINDGHWLRYDDGSVNDAHQFHCSNAYILFYCA